MKPIAGLNRDTSAFVQPENTYRYANNAVVSETLGNLESLPDDLLKGSFPDDFLFMGWAVVDDYVLAVGYDPILTDGQIWKLTSPDYVPTLIISDPEDVWELSQEVSGNGLPFGEFQFAWSKDSAGRVQFVWAPLKTQPKFVNIDRLDEDINGGTLDNPLFPVVLTVDYTRKAFLIFPEAYLPPPTVAVVEDEGTVISGSYFFTHKYEYADGSSTDWSIPSNPAYVVADTAPFGEWGQNLHGDEGGKISPKAVEILIDTDLEQPPGAFVRIGYISYRAGVIFAGILSRISLDSLNANFGKFLYTGEQPDIDLGDNIAELITPKAHYRTVGTLTSLTNRLYVGNLVEADNLLYQDVANATTVKWCLKDDFTGLDIINPSFPIESSRNKTYQVKVPTFGPGEVQAFYLSFLKNDGTRSRAFHIPGRKHVNAVVADASTGSFLLNANAAGDGLVGITFGAGPTITVSPAPGDSPAVVGALLETAINLDGSATALHQGGGSIAMFWNTPGVVGNQAITDATTDTAMQVTAIGGMSGGTEAVLGDTDDVEVTPGSGGTLVPRYKVQDTIEQIDTHCGYMGYWANPDEFYPSSTDFDSARDPGAIPVEWINTVRHHRFPTIKWLYQNTDVPGSGTPLSPDFNIALDAIFDVPVPQDLADQIEGVIISYAKKDIGDTINVGTQLAVPNGSDGDGTSKSICGQWIIPPLDTVPASNAPDGFIVGNDFLRFHGLNLVEKFTSVNPKYVDCIYWYEQGISNYFEGSSELFWPITVIDPEDPTQRVIQPDAYKYGVVDFPRLFLLAPIVSPAERFNVKDFSYVRNGTKTSIDGTSIDNMVGEDALVVRISPTLPLATPLEDLGIPLGAPDTQLYRWLFASLMTIPENIAYPFTNQTIVFAGFKKVDNAATYVVEDTRLSADFFNGYMQYNVTGPVNGSVNTTTDEAGQFRGEGTKIVYNCPTMSPINISAQFFEPGEFNSYIAPIQGAAGRSSTIAGVPSVLPDSVDIAKTWYFWDQNIYQVQNKYYNNDFNRLREFFIYDIYDGVPITNNKFPVTIAFSLQQIADSPVANWRTWLINNKYTQPVYPGDIINLEGAGNQKLFIHHRYSLFLTKDRTTLKGTVDVTLGSSDIFEVVPFEVITTDEGHTGLGRREWTDMNVMGYVWANHDHGKIYLHDGEQLQEISSSGMRIFFREFMDKNSNFGSSFSFVYDEDRKRLLLSAFGADTEQRFNLSYSSIGSFWTSFHDETFFNGLATRDKVVLFRKYDEPAPFTLGDITPPGVNPVDVFAVAQGEFGGYDIDPFIIEVVATLEDVSSKYLKAISFSTNLVDVNNVDVEDDTFSKIFIYTDTKTSGEIILEAYNAFPKPGQNMRRLENNWMMNQFRNLWDGVTPIVIKTLANRLGPNPAAANPALPWYEKGRMRDRAFIIRLTYDKATTNKLVLSSVYFDFKQSIR